MSILQSLANVLSRYEQRDIFVRQGIPAETLVGPGAFYGLSVDQTTATRVIAVQAAWSLLADAAGLLPVNYMQKQGTARVELPMPDFLRTPDPLDPNITTEEHFSQLVVSLASDGNSFTLATPHVYDAASLQILDPTRVEVKKKGGAPMYRWRPEEGGMEDLGPDQIIHISRLRRPGHARGMSPIEEAASSLSRTLAADRFGGRVLNNGVLVTGMFTVPGPMTDDALIAMRKQVEEQYVGPTNAGKAGILANGAKFEYPHLDIASMALMDVLGWGVLDVARCYHIPPHLLGDNTPGSMSHASVEQQYIEFTDIGISPYTRRIEAGYRRLLPEPLSYLRFNLSAKIRADIKTRMEAHAVAAQNKIETRDEIRSYEEYGPADDAPGVGTEWGGFLETPNNNGPGAVRQTA